jgi:hypothetical protein
MIEQDKHELRGVMKEISNSMTRISGEKDYIKEAIIRASDKYQMNKKILRKMAKVFHQNNFTDEVTEMEEFQKLYEDVIIT